MRATARRVGSSIHDCGRYNNAPSNHARDPVQSAAVTATWQFAILPRAPQYWRATPTEYGPCFGKLVLSMINTPRRWGSTSNKRRQIRLHRLALAVAEHAVHVRAQREPLRSMTEAALERLEPAHQSLNPRGGGAIDHR